MKDLWAMTLPITAMNCVVYLRALISVLCLGRLGSLELAGGALSIGFTNITGYSVLVGLASALEPLCSQAYGSRNWDLLALSLQRSVALLLLAALPISLLWLLLRPILLFLGQDPAITAVAATYCLYSLPDLLTNSLLQPLRVFLRSQGVAAPMFYCSALALALHLPLNLLFVFVLELGVPGVAAAAVLTNVNMVLFMLGYLWVCRRGEGGEGVVGPWQCWRGVGPVVKGVGPMMELAVPSCLSICLEWWWYEIMTVMAGLLPEPRVTVAAAAILIQTTSFMYTMPMALAGCVSSRVYIYSSSF